MSKANIAKIYDLLKEASKLMLFSLITMPGILLVIAFYLSPTHSVSTIFINNAESILKDSQGEKIKDCKSDVGEGVNVTSSQCKPVMMDKAVWITSMDRELRELYMMIAMISSFLYLFLRPQIVVVFKNTFGVVNKKIDS